MSEFLSGVKRVSRVRNPARATPARTRKQKEHFVGVRRAINPGRKLERVAWMGGSNPPARMPPEAVKHARLLFKEQMATWKKHWGDKPNAKVVATFRNRANHDAWATYRDKHREENPGARWAYFVGYDKTTGKAHIWNEYRGKGSRALAAEFARDNGLKPQFDGPFTSRAQAKAFTSKVHRTRNPRGQVKQRAMWYIGTREDGSREIKKVVSAVRQPWISAVGPFTSKRDALIVQREAMRRSEFIKPARNPVRIKTGKSKDHYKLYSRPTTRKTWAHTLSTDSVKVLMQTALKLREKGYGIRVVRV